MAHNSLSSCFRGVVFCLMMVPMKRLFADLSPNFYDVPGDEAQPTIMVVGVAITAALVATIFIWMRRRNKKKSVSDNSRDTESAAEAQKEDSTGDAR